MKKILAAVALIAVFASCQHGADDSFEPTLKRVTIEPVLSPATELSFEDGDKVGLTIIKEDRSKHVDNGLMTHISGVFVGDIAWYEGATASKMIAYYPYSSAGMPTSFSVATNQTTGYSASDLMGVEKSNVTPTNDAIGMLFKHLLSRIVVQVKQADTDISSVVLQNSIPTAVIDLENLTATADASVAVTDITTQTVTANSTYRAIIVPQTVSLTVIVTTTQGKTHTQKLSSATLASGGQYNINVEIAKGQLNVSMTGDIRDWTNEGEIEAAEEEVDYTNGTFILNEGNMSNESGTLIYIDRNGTMHDNVYEQVNGSKLGNTCQDLYIRNGKMYFIAQKGGNDGKLVVADATTIVKQQGIPTIPTISSPSHIAVTSNNTIYLRGMNGVYRYNITDNTVKKLINSGANNRMVSVGDKVFSYDGSSISVLQDGSDTIVETIDLGQSIIGMIPSSDGGIWAASTSTIFKLNPNTYTFVGQAVSGTTIGSISAAPSISAFGNRIYFRNSTKVWCHDFTSGTTVQKCDVLSYLNYNGNAGTFYNGFGVHPETEEVCYTSMKGFGLNYLINYIGIFDFSNASAPLKVKYNDYLHFPAGVYYPETFK